MSLTTAPYPARPTPPDDLTVDLPVDLLTPPSSGPSWPVASMPAASWPTSTGGTPPAGTLPAGTSPAVTADRRPARRVDRARAVRVALWSVVVLFAGAYAASLLTPLWFAVQGQRLLVVTSGSMSPAFEAGDAVVLQPITDPSTLRVGQVVSFWPPGSDDLVTHRIEGMTMLPVLEQDTATGRMVPVLDAAGRPIERPYLITQGDANDVRDPDAVPVSRVRGIVLDVHTGWGALLERAGSDLGRLVLLGPPLAALAAMEIASVVQARRGRRPEDREQGRTDDLVLG